MEESKVTTTALGQNAEDRALSLLVAEGLTLVERNFRVARGPRARGGEIDLVMRDRDHTLVFVEVRSRRRDACGGAAASVTPAKQRRCIFAARHYLLRYSSPPPCRFDVVVIEGPDIQWLPAAFDAGT